MLNLKKKNFAYMEKPINEKGITYLSILFSLAVFLVMMPFVGFIYQSIDTKSYQEELAVDQCFQFIQDEFDHAVATEINESALSFSLPDGTISTISQYQNLIRRQVSGQGHEILLREVADVQFLSTSYGLQINIKTLSGGSYEKKMYLFFH